MSALRPAVFLDRDNTLIEDPGYIDHPDKVHLLPDVGAALRRLRDAGYRLVVVTNQSGLARGYFDQKQLDAVHERLRALLRAEGVDLDGIYFSPYLAGPEAVVEAYRSDSELRKPKAGMLFQAAQEMGLDLAHSWMIGDGLRDMRAGRTAGCRTILLGTPVEAASERAADVDFRAETLSEAAKIIETKS